MPVNVKGILFAAAAVGAALVLARARSALPALAKPASGRSVQDTPYARIDAYVQGQTARLNLPGAALAIVEGDEIAHLRTFGKAHPGGEAPTTPQTPYFIGSLTKSFTALAAGAEQSPWPRPALAAGHHAARRAQPGIGRLRLGPAGHRPAAHAAALHGPTCSG